MARKARFAFVDDRSPPSMPVKVPALEEQGGLIERMDKVMIEISRDGDHRRAQDIHTVSLRLGELRNVLADAKASIPDDLADAVEKLIALI